MTDKDIERLARELAKENAPIGFSDEVKKEDAILANTLVYEKVIKDILRDHCIVPKEIVKAIYNRKTIPSQEDIDKKFIEECLIEALFGTELFEERREE